MVSYQMCEKHEKAVGGGRIFCKPCQIVDTGAPLPLTVDTLIAVTKTNPTILKRVPKYAPIPRAKLLNEALDDIVAKPHDESCWVCFFL